MCPGTFCPPQPWPMGPPSPPTGEEERSDPYMFSEVDLQTFSLIKAGFWYGGTVFQSVMVPGREPLFMQDPAMTGSNSEQVPILMIYGTGEENILGNGTRAMVSYEQFETEKGIVVIEDLDHNGPVDLPITASENIIPTTLTAEEAVDRVAKTVTIWLDFVLTNDDYEDDDDFCAFLDEELGEDSFIDTCLHEPADEMDETIEDDINPLLESSSAWSGMNALVTIVASMASFFLSNC